MTSPLSQLDSPLSPVRQVAALNPSFRLKYPLDEGDTLHFYARIAAAAHITCLSAEPSPPLSGEGQGPPYAQSTPSTSQAASSTTSKPRPLQTLNAQPPQPGGQRLYIPPYHKKNIYYPKLHIRA